MTNNASLLELFFSFAKVGILTFGGGLSMLPMLEHEIVKNKKWATEDELLEYFAVGQCTPGIIAVNTATFIGFKQRSILGGIFATLGVVFPSFVIINILSVFFAQFGNNPYVIKAFAGIRLAVCALMTYSLIKLAKKAVSNIETAITAFLALTLQLFIGISPVIIVVCAFAYGLLVSNRKKKNGLS